MNFLVIVVSMNFYWLRALDAGFGNYQNEFANETSLCSSVNFNDNISMAFVRFHNHPHLLSYCTNPKYNPNKRIYEKRHDGTSIPLCALNYPTGTKFVISEGYLSTICQNPLYIPPSSKSQNVTKVKRSANSIDEKKIQKSMNISQINNKPCRYKKINPWKFYHPQLRNICVVQNKSHQNSIK